jgi:large repetitive protein
LTAGVSRVLLTLAAVVTGVALVAAGTGTTFSAFSGSTSNSGNTFAAAASFGCASAGTVTASANIDSWVDRNSPNSNFGGDQILKVHKQNSRAARALVRFALPNVPNGCSVTGAQLRLFAASSNGSETVQARRITQDWAEHTVRWNQQPSTTVAAMATTTGASGWNQWTVTAQVQAMYAGTNRGFQIRYENEGNPTREMQLHARDKGSQHPELRITFG